MNDKNFPLKILAREILREIKAEKMILSAQMQVLQGISDKEVRKYLFRSPLTRIDKTLYESCRFIYITALSSSYKYIYDAQNNSNCV